MILLPLRAAVVAGEKERQTGTTSPAHDGHDRYCKKSVWYSSYLNGRFMKLKLLGDYSKYFQKNCKPFLKKNRAN
jgi:hypothetical protein